MPIPIQIPLNFKDFRIKTKAGWFKVTALILSLILFLFLTVAPAFDLGFSLAYLMMFFFLALTAESLWLIIWAIYSGRIFISKPNKITVVFAVNVEPESQKIFHELLKSFKRELRKANLDHLFEIKTLEDIKFDRKKAEKYVIEERVNLLIWGDTEELSLKGEPVTEFHLNFTYWFKAPPVRRPTFRAIIDEGLKGRVWDVFHLNKLPTLKIVSYNLSESSIFIIARCLISFGFLKVTFDLLLPMYSRLRKVADKSAFPNYTKFKRMVENHLIQLGSLLCYAFMKQDSIDEAERYGLKSLEFNSSFFPALLNLALVYWKKGDENRAKQFSKRAQKAEPSNVLNRFNKAFFFIKDGNYKKAAEQYRRISGVPLETNILDIIDFLEAEYEKRGEEPGLLFAAGYLNCQFADRIRGSQQLSRFIDLTGGEPKYEPLINLARPL